MNDVSVRKRMRVTSLVKMKVLSRIAEAACSEVVAVGLGGALRSWIEVTVVQVRWGTAEGGGSWC